MNPQLFVFNPSEPSGTLTASGGALLEGRAGPCGDCRACPPHWKIDVDLSPGGLPERYGGVHILSRRIANPRRADARCVWLSPRVTTDPGHIGPANGSLWRLCFHPWEDHSGGSVNYAIGQWTLSAGGWFYGATEPVGQAVVDTHGGGGTYPTWAVYRDRSRQSEVPTLVGDTPWTCVGTNTMHRVSDPENQFPAQLEISPWWP